MATDRLVHKKRISPMHIRELDVYYDKGGMNYFDYSPSPKGIFFASTVFEQEEDSAWKTLKICLGSKTPGVGYVLVTPLDNYRAKALREVRARVEALENLKVILTGAVVPADLSAPPGGMVANA